jgi:hypothetical protein
MFFGSFDRAMDHTLLSSGKLAVQNFAACIVTRTRKYDHVTPVLQQLGAIPVKYMLKLREAIFAFKCLKGLAPSYFV